MSIVITGLKVGLTKLAKTLATESPGTAYIALNGAVVAGEIAAAQALGQQSEIYIPVYGPTGIDAGVVSYAAVSLGFLAGLGSIAALAAGVVVAPGVGLLAIGIGVVAAAVNPAVQTRTFDVADALLSYLQSRVLQGTLPPVVSPVAITDFDFWTIPGGLNLSPAISPTLGTLPDPLVKTIIYVDPLVLDLDGDGLAITPLSGRVLFDANGDAIKTGTAWVRADDGLLVRDLNGNGLIDSGRELFGDETILTTGVNAGKKAAHGFAALADLNSNGDALFNALDVQFASLRIWRDLNQDGISQAGELKTLAASGVQSINLASTSSTQQFGDAMLVQSGSFTRVDAGGVATQGQAGSFILAQNNFTTSFAPILVSNAAKALPAVAGSGWVRGLQEAATLSPELVAMVNQAQNAPTRAGYESADTRLHLYRRAIPNGRKQTCSVPPNVSFTARCTVRLVAIRVSIPGVENGKINPADFLLTCHRESEYVIN